MVNIKKTVTALLPGRFGLEILYPARMVRQTLMVVPKVIYMRLLR